MSDAVLLNVCMAILCVCARIYIYIYTCVYVCMYVCMYIYISNAIHTLVHIPTSRPSYGYNTHIDAHMLTTHKHIPGIRRLADYHAGLALEALEEFQDCEAKDSLKVLVHYMLEEGQQRYACV